MVPVYLSDAALAGLGIAPREMANAVEAALRAKADGRLFTAPKAALLPGGGRYVMSTLAAGGEDFIVVKTVGVFPENADRDLPAINGAIQVLDAKTGLLRAVMDAGWVTAVRTAALSAVAARRLANPDATTVAFVGCGVQASSHLAAFLEMFPLQRVLAVGRGQANVERLCAEASGLGLTAGPASAETALTEADIVVTSVTLDYSIAPFLDAGLMKPGAFAAITDLFIPWHAESAAAFDTVVVDDLEQERAAEKPML
ncbi:MAG: ornithine cyclodeaminase family protein, partial [Pseudomonadota bacterium]